MIEQWIFWYSALAWKLFIDVRKLDKIFELEKMQGSKIPEFSNLFNKTRIYNMKSVEYIANKYPELTKKYWQEKRLEEEAIRIARENLRNKRLE